VFIIRRSTFYYMASGIITPVGGRPVHRLREDCARDGHLQEPLLSQPVHGTATYRNQSSLNLCTGRPPTGTSPLSTCARDGHLQEPVLSQPVHGTATYRCDDTRCCVIQFRPPDDEHTVPETCRGIK